MEVPDWYRKDVAPKVTRKRIVVDVCLLLWMLALAIAEAHRSAGLPWALFFGVVVVMECYQTGWDVVLLREKRAVRR